MEEFNVGRGYGVWLLENKRRGKIKIDPEKCTQIHYRPFDFRWIYLDKNLVWNSRPANYHLLKGENLGFIYSRQGTEEKWDSIQVTDKIIDGRVHYSGRGMAYLSPLYLYENEEKRVNVSKKGEEIIKKFSPFSAIPEEILNYIYGLLHHPLYREKYNLFLKRDYPRIKYPSSSSEFFQISQIGKRLKELHLLKEIPKGEKVLEVKGESLLVEKVKRGSRGIVSINPSTFLQF
jgi:predicted helicase